MKKLAAVLALTLLLGFCGARLLSGGDDADTVVATGCDPAAAIPDSGALSLAYTGPSAPPHVGHIDYVLGGRLLWESQAALDCIGADVDAAYEHEIAFEGDFAGRIWRLEHTFPDDAQVYIDESVNDRDGSTVLVLGVFRPEYLTAEVDYWFSLETPLLAQDDSVTHDFVLDGVIADRICAAPDAWCVERSNVESRRTLIGPDFNFDVETGGCWAWTRDTVGPCSDDAEAQPDGDDAEATASIAPADGTASAGDGAEIPEAGAAQPAASELDAAADAESSAASSGGTATGAGSGGATTSTTLVSSRTPTASPSTTVPSSVTTTSPGTTLAPRPGATTTTSPSVTTTTLAPTTSTPSATTTPVTTRPTSPTTTAPTTTPPTTRPTTAPPITAAPTTTAPPATAPPTTATPTTTPPPPVIAPSFGSVSATSPRAGRIRVVATIAWPAGATSTTCVTTVDGAVVSIKDCGSRLNVNVKGIAAGTHTVRVRACNQSVACADSAAVSVTVG